MLLLAIAVAIAAVLGASAARAQEPDAGAVRVSARKPKLALLPMVVHSNEDPEYLRQGLSDMLEARFTKEAVIDVIAVADPVHATTDLESALATAANVDAEYVVFGSFTRFGQGASLDVWTASTAAGPDGETMREIFVHSGSIGNVIPDLDDLVGKITRFAVGDYVPAGEGPPGTERRGMSATELLGRIQALEKRLGALETAQ
jgi:TolB-like protein